MKIVILIIIISAIFLLIYRLLKRYRRWIQKISACGFSNPPNPKSFAFAIWLVRILTFIQVGEVRVIGRENLKKQDPVIICPNHPHYIDAAIVPILMERQGRYMLDEDVLRFGFGLGALICVPAGGFPVRDGTRGSNLHACEAGAQYLASGYTLLIFPEGHTNFSLKMQPLKKGAIRIARLAENKLGRPVFIVPAHIRYGRYPSGWIRKIKPPLQYFIVFLGFFYFRRGATVIFGEPISTSDLPASEKSACNFLAEKIQSLDTGERSYGVDKGIYDSFALTKL